MPPSPDVFISKCVCKYGGQNLTDPKAILKKYKKFSFTVIQFKYYNTRDYKIVKRPAIMQNIKTIAGTFTIGTYEIPKQYVCAKTPTITQKNDICEIVTYDQQITVNGHNYAPVLHQNCMQPEQITLYPLVIRQEHATLTVSDRYHTGHWKSGDDTQISDWRPKLMHRGCVPCTNCGRC